MNVIQQLELAIHDLPNQYSDKTCAQYRKFLRSFTELLQSKQALHAIASHDLQSWFEKNKWGKQTQAQAKCALRYFVKHANIQWDIPRGETKQASFALTHKHLQQMLVLPTDQFGDTLDEQLRYKATLGIMIAAKINAARVARLRVADYTNGILYIKEKGEVRLPFDVRNTLERLLDILPESAPTFPLIPALHEYDSPLASWEMHRALSPVVLSVAPQQEKYIKFGEGLTLLEQHLEQHHV